MFWRARLRADFDQPALDLGQELIEGLDRRRCGLWQISSAQVATDAGRKIGHVDHRHRLGGLGSRAEVNMSCVDHSGELAQVAGPIVGLKNGQGLASEAAAGGPAPLVGTFQETLSQEQKVVPRLRKGSGWELPAHSACSKARAAADLLECGGGIACGGGDQPHSPIQSLGKFRLQVAR